jgi:hypothetical protein
MAQAGAREPRAFASVFPAKSRVVTNLSDDAPLWHARCKTTAGF